MTIEHMTSGTVPLVAALEKECFTEAWSEASIAGELTNPYAIWLTAHEDGEFAGYLGIQYGPDGADIMNIATVPGFRGRGVAKALISEMLRLLEEKDLGWLTLEVRESNAPAISLYTAMGFRQVGVRPKYYRKPTEAALLMTYYLKEESQC